MEDIIITIEPENTPHIDIITLDVVHTRDSWDDNLDSLLVIYNQGKELFNA